MKKGRWMAVVVTTGLVLSLGGCASDMAYYAMDAVGDYLPDLLESLLGAATETS